MKKIVLILTLVVFCFSISAQEWGVVRYAKSNVNIRSHRTTNSDVVSKLVMGEKVKADYLLDNWYAIFKTDEKVRGESRRLGYVYAPLLVPNKPSNVSLSSKSATYKIVEKQDVSYRGKARMVYRIVLNVNKLPSKEEIKKISTKIWSNGNKGWDEFTVFSYMPGMNTGSVAYGIAEFRPTGMIEFNINSYALMGTKWK